MIRRARLVAGRELAAERRHPDGLAAALTFTGMLVLLESLAFGPGRAHQPDVASGVFWIAILFTSVLMSGRSFDRELEDDAVDAILVFDGGREALFAGKAIALAALLAIVGTAAGVFSIVLLDLEIAEPGLLILVAVAGLLALPPVVVLVGALALRVRARVAVVPILAFPMLVPQLIATTQGASSAMTGDTAASLGWTGLLVAFALVYAVLGLTIVPAAIE